MKKLLIQFTGAQSVGKTTLVNYLLEQYPGAVKIGEVTRNLKQWGAIDKADILASSDGQMRINAELLLQYTKAINDQPEMVIAERTPICCLAYAAHIDQVDKHTLDYTSRMIQTLYHIKDYIVITIYIPPTIPFVEDSIRNKESRVLIDNTIKSILQDFSIEHIVMQASDLELRKQALHAIINQAMSMPTQTPTPLTYIKGGACLK